MVPGSPVPGGQVAFRRMIRSNTSVNACRWTIAGWSAVKVGMRIADGCDMEAPLSNASDEVNRTRLRIRLAALRRVFGHGESVRGDGVSGPSVRGERESIGRPHLSDTMPATAHFLRFAPMAPQRSRSVGVGQA
jgi:hypothetical protein